MGLAFIMLAISCSKNNQKEQTPKPDQTNLNSFKMNLNGVAWTPTAIDSCNRTFSCDQSKWGQDDYFRIEAFKDRSQVLSSESRNYFELAICKVNNKGDILIDGRFRDIFSNYARFTINEFNKKVIYQNKEIIPAFKVSITQVFETVNCWGCVSGTFEGFLYNIDNPVDSIKVEKGEFIFKKPYSVNFNHCKE